LFIFLFRDSFQYQPYTSYHSLYQPCDKYCSEKWSKFVKPYPASDLTEAKNILNTHVRAISGSTCDKLLHIGNFIYTRFNSQQGNPTYQFLALSPLNQYKALSTSDTVKLWCGNFAEMFTLFCWSQGIICRTIEIMNPGDHHVLNESYIPETGQWVMTDL